MQSLHHGDELPTVDQERLHEVERLISSSNFGLASDKIADLLLSNPTSAHVHFLAGVLAVHTEKPDEACWHSLMCLA
jgi:hypothetical protein